MSVSANQENLQMQHEVHRPINNISVPRNLNNTSQFVLNPKNVIMDAQNAAVHSVENLYNNHKCEQFLWKRNSGCEYFFIWFDYLDEKYSKYLDENNIGDMINHERLLYFSDVVTQKSSHHNTDCLKCQGHGVIGFLESLKKNGFLVNDK